MIKKPIKITLVMSIVVLILSQVFLGAVLPVLNFLDNEKIDPENPDDKGNERVIINHGDDIFNEDDPYHKKSEEGEDNPGGYVDEGEYTPGQIAKAKLIKASEVKFENGTKNILLLGENSLESLFDTIFVLNINPRNHVMKLISIPRDTYVPHAQTTQDAMKKVRYYNSPGSFKLNAVYYVGKSIIKYQGGKFGNSGIDYMCAVIGQLLPGCEIDEYAYVDFKGFMDVVDVIGGVYVTVDEDIYNPEGQLLIKKGYQMLNAEKALQYCRYRVRLDEHGVNTGKGSDNYRKVNQANFLAEVFPQVMSKENMTYGKIIDLMDTLKNSVFHSFSVADVSEYLGIGVDFAKGLYSLNPYVIDGEFIDPFNDNAYYVRLDS